MKYQQKSFSHGYADSPAYAKNYDAAFKKKSTRDGGWVHDMAVKHYAECCPCSACAKRTCTGAPLGRDYNGGSDVARHCRSFKPGPNWESRRKGKRR